MNVKSNKKIEVFCLSPNLIKDQDKFEVCFAKRILKESKVKRIFVIMGNVHASKKELNFGRIKIIPTGLLIFNELKEKMLSILIIPQKGKFFNRKINIFKLKDYVSFKNNFDYLIKLKSITPCSFI